MIKIEENKDLVRDPHSKAVLQYNTERLLEHRRKKEMFKQMIDNNEKIETIENKLENLQNEISSLKELMMEVIKKI
jgi:hypothetical protein